MRKVILGLAVLALLVVSTPLHAQTYDASNVPFVCNAATAGGGPLSFGMFFCRGIYFESNTIELFFGTQFELATPPWSIGPYTVTQSLMSFTQPNPVSCPVTGPFRTPGCPAGTVPGTLELNWSGTDNNKVQHNGSISATWVNEQFCGGKACWYHPVLETVSLTIYQ